MKTYLFLAQLLFGINAFAQNASSEDEFLCMRDLKEMMNPRHYYEPENRGTILYFLREGHDVGMFDREHNPAMLIIERRSLQVCPMNFGSDGNARFRVSDGAGSLKMAYNPSAAPHFRDLGMFTSAPTRPCENALTGASQTAATAVLQKIIKQALKSYLIQNGNQATIPSNCNGAAGLTQYDISQVRDEASRAEPVPAPTTAPVPTNN